MYRLANFSTNASRLATAHQSSSLRPLGSGSATVRFEWRSGDRTQSPTRLRRSPYRRPAGGSQAHIKVLTVPDAPQATPMDTIYTSCAQMDLRRSTVGDPTQGLQRGTRPQEDPVREPESWELCWRECCVGRSVRWEREQDVGRRRQEQAG